VTKMKLLHPDRIINLGGIEPPKVWQSHGETQLQYGAKFTVIKFRIIHQHCKHGSSDCMDASVDAC